MDVSRLLTMVLTHILLQEQMVQGVQMMKFAVNHRWKFRSYELAFSVGLMQVLMVFMVEVVTCLILIFASETLFDVIANYIIVLVIADFSDNFYSINTDERHKKMITDETFSKFFTIEVTTSKSAIDQIQGNRLAPEDILHPEH